jgi:hypothetical protein
MLAAGHIFVGIFNTTCMQIHWLFDAIVVRSAPMISMLSLLPSGGLDILVMSATGSGFDMPNSVPRLVESVITRGLQNRHCVVC